MSLRWDEANLERHAAKHFLGDEREGWSELLDPDARHEWARWRREAEAVRCSFDGHPACPEADRCRPVQREASGPYRALVEREWSFAEVRDFLVRFADAQGRPTLCGTGPRGILVFAVEPATGDRVAKTAYRLDPRQPVRTAVRKMRSYASQGPGRWTMVDLVRLETRLLGAPGPLPPKIRALADDLLAGGG